LSRRWVPDGDTWAHSGERRVRVIVADGADAGYVSTAVYEQPTGAYPSGLYLHQLMILPRFQSRGIGSACLRRVQAEARELGRPLQLRVLRVNPRALAFYLAAGCRIVGGSESHISLQWPADVSTMEIREFDPLRDRQAVRRCFIELQDFERNIDPRTPPGEHVADTYLDLMFQRCREFSGVVLVAVMDQAVVGYVTIWTRFRSSEPDDDPAEHGFIPDLVVLAACRGRGIGRRLLRAAEARAREAGARTIRLSVKAGNAGARSLYAAEGFEDAEIFLEKAL
jgi:ribosomal protein S18 acetylase RimI-like enzyme